MMRPHVSINMAMSVDGKITSAAREYPKLTSREDKRLMDEIRAESDALVIGAGTLRADDPPLHVRDPEMRARREALGKPGALPCVVVSRSLELPLASKFFTPSDGARRIVATLDAPSPERRDALEGRAEIWQLGPDDVDVARLCERLAQEGVERLLVEGGGELNWAFVARDLVDELYVTIAPTLLGGRAAPTLLGGTGFAMAAQKRLELVQCQAVEGEIFAHYRVAR